MECIRKRGGKLSISWDVIEKFPQEAMQVLSKVLVIRAERMYWPDAVEYTALSPEFDVVKEGHCIPKYDVLIMKCEEQGQISVEFVRED